MIIILFLCARPGIAQVSCFAEIALDRHTVYVQQPFKVTITVLTATWYTEPLQFDNLQIPNAFTIPFSQTTPGMFDVKGSQFAGLQFYFIVFPYRAGQFTLPPIHITASTPPRGSAEAIKVPISTPTRSFTVKPIPTQFSNTNWLVAKNVLISEHWNKPLQHLKAGDIIERTITIDARGTLPQFIPALPPQHVSFASTYLQDAALQDERTAYDANGRLTQTITYLLGKAGDFEIPPVEIDWWNPLNSRLYKKATAAVRIHVASNPNLGMMTTLRDSLAATQTNTVDNPVKRSPYTIAGMPWYRFTAYALGCLLAIYLLTVFALRLWRSLKAKRNAYRQSESFYFHQLLTGSSSPQTLIQLFYPWWDRVVRRDRQPDATDSWQRTRQQDLLRQWNQLNANVFNDSHQQPACSAADIKKFKTTLTAYRKTNKKTNGDSPQQLINDNQYPWPPNLKTQS